MHKKLLLAASFGFLLLYGCGSSKPVAKDAVSFSPEDEKMYTDVQRTTFNYFWDGAEPNSGLARERYHMDGIYPENDKMIITSGGGGFGVMAILVGIERGFITRAQGMERMERIVRFLETADRFHGAWPHWWNGETGKTKPFSSKDDGGDLVETAFMIQGLLCVRQYFKDGNETEKALANRIDKLWKEVEWDWYRKGGENVLYWHWSPRFGWDMNFAVKGYNECLIMYILAAASPTHGVPAEVYHQGWAMNGKIKDTTEAFGHKLTLSHQGGSKYGGPLFWAHYSFLGLDPRGLRDCYADYWEHNKAHTLINYDWCAANPKGFKGYGPDNWGLTASYSVKFYAAHAPGEEDRGVISPTAALSSMPYTPEQSMRALRNWYTNLRDSIYGPFGFYDAFSLHHNWYPQKYLAIDQGPIVVMMENHRSGLLWNLFMSCPEVQQGLKKLGYQSPWIKSE
ncbi:beta-glucosidase [Flavisolibacter sp. BT320]|nr:beta-glucosidase [Flavisolibacter longurius]